MSDSMDLRGVQSLFWKLVTAPEGVAKGVRALRAQGELDDEDLSFFVRPGAPLAAVARLDVYADMYFYRLRDCLAEDFSRVKAWIAAEAASKAGTK